MTQKAKILVLNHHQIQQKITRIAFEIYERNAGEKQLTIAGLTGMGYVFAELMVAKLKEIAPFDVQLIKVELDKSNPKIEEVILSAHEPLEGKSIILVDDVLNTGKTLAFAMVPFIEQEP